MLLVGLHKGIQPVVCKFMLEDADVLHEHQVLTYLLRVPALKGPDGIGGVQVGGTICCPKW